MTEAASRAGANVLFKHPLVHSPFRALVHLSACYGVPRSQRQHNSLSPSGSSRLGTRHTARSRRCRRTLSHIQTFGPWRLSHRTHTCSPPTGAPRAGSPDVKHRCDPRLSALAPEAERTTSASGACTGGTCSAFAVVRPPSTHPPTGRRLGLLARRLSAVPGPRRHEATLTDGFLWEPSKRSVPVCPLHHVVPRKGLPWEVRRDLIVARAARNNQRTDLLNDPDPHAYPVHTRM